MYALYVYKCLCVCISVCVCICITISVVTGVGQSLKCRHRVYEANNEADRWVITLRVEMKIGPGTASTGAAPFASIHPPRIPSQPMHWDADINQGQQRMRVKKWPGTRSAAAINQELIQSWEMPRLINLCQHFLCCQAQSLVSSIPSPSPLSTEQRSVPLLRGDKKKEVEPQRGFPKVHC